MLCSHCLCNRGTRHSPACNTHVNAWANTSQVHWHEGKCSGKQGQQCTQQMQAVHTCTSTTAFHIQLHSLRTAMHGMQRMRTMPRHAGHTAQPVSEQYSESPTCITLVPWQNAHSTCLSPWQVRHTLAGRCSCTQPTLARVSTHGKMQRCAPNARHAVVEGLIIQPMCCTRVQRNRHQPVV